MAGRPFSWARRGALFVRIMNRKDICVGFGGFRAQVASTGIRSKSTRIHAHHVDCRLTIDNPLGKLPAGATGGRYPKTMAFVEPKIANSPGRTNNRRPVGGIGDGAIINLLDTYLTKDRNTGDRGFDIRAEAIEIVLKKLVFAVRIWT